MISPISSTSPAGAFPETKAPVHNAAPTKAAEPPQDSVHLSAAAKALGDGDSH